MPEIFCRGETVEYDKVIYETKERSVVRGIYVERLDDRYSSVKAGKLRPLIVRTERLRKAAAS